MLRRNYRKSSGVIVDVCNEHGTWLDADELEQIAGFLLSGGRTSEMLRPEPTPGSESGKLPPAAAFARASGARQVERAREQARRQGEANVSLFEMLFDLLT